MRTILTMLVLTNTVLFAAEGALIESMDAPKLALPKDKARFESVEGKVGKAVKFSFEDGSAGKFVMSRIRGTPEWDQAAGISFWVKGDGSKKWGALELIWNDDYALRYDVAFPIDSTEWKKITVAWRDLIPNLPKPGSLPIDPKNGNAPSKFTTLWFGKFFFWRDYSPYSYSIDEIRLEPTIELDTNDYKPAGDPLARVKAKLKAGQPVTIVTIGDSLTDYNHWANKAVPNWPTLLKEGLQAKFKSAVTLVNPAIGGTQMRQGLIVMPRWLQDAPEPDLVTVCYGYNDYDEGMRGPMFESTSRDAVERIRRATKGKSDVLLITPCRALERWEPHGELTEGSLKAAAAVNAGVADIFAAFGLVPEAQRPDLFCRDKVHLGKRGHEMIAETVLGVLGKSNP